jgi:hypothetical protein
MQNHEHEERFRFPDEKPAAEEKLQIEIEGEAEPEIEVVDDTPEEDRGRKPMKEAPSDVTDDELAQYSDGVKKRIQHFSKGYHEERRAKEAALREREEAVRLAQNLVEENKKLKGSLSQGQQALHEQAKKAVEAEVETAKQKVREALESGDPNHIVYWQEQLAKAVNKAERVNNFKPAPVQPTENVVQTEPQAVSAPPVDPKAVEWQRQNTWFGTDEEMTGFAIALHNKLVKSGVDPQSDEYYKRVNARVREVFPNAFPSEKRQSNVVAPATRSTAPKKVVLTKSAVEIAKRLGVPLEAYAKQVAEQMRKQNG